MPTHSILSLYLPVSLYQQQCLFFIQFKTPATTDMRLLLHPHNLNNNKAFSKKNISIREQEGGIQTQPKTWREASSKAKRPCVHVGVCRLIIAFLFAKGTGHQALERASTAATLGQPQPQDPSAFSVGTKPMQVAGCILHSNLAFLVLRNRESLSGDISGTICITRIHGYLPLQIKLYTQHCIIFIF